MDFNLPQQNNSEKKATKKEIEFCERLFIENLGRDFPVHLDMVINHISAKGSETSGFKEKQALTEAVKKLSASKFSITEQFKSLLRKHIKNRIENKTLLEIKLNWDNMTFTNEEQSLENQTIINFKNSLKTELGENLAKVSEYTNFLLGDNKDIFSEDILSQVLSHTLKGSFASMNSYCLAIDGFAKTWALNLAPYYVELREHLETSAIHEKIKQSERDAADALNNIPRYESEKDNSEILVKENKNHNVLTVPSMFISGDIDLDAFLRALPPAPKIERKDDSILSLSDAADLDINDLSNLPQISPQTTGEEQNESSNKDSSENNPNNGTLANNSNINPGVAPPNNSSISGQLSALDALAQHGNIQVIVVQGGDNTNQNPIVLSANNIGQNNGKSSNLNSEQNNYGEYAEGYDGPREAPIDPEVARELAIQKIANDINKALLSQQRIDPIDFYSLIKKDLVLPEISENESKIILLPRFISTLKDVQGKFLKVTPEIFNRTKIFKKSIFLEILKNKLFAENINYYDIYVLRLMHKTYEAIYHNENISQYQKLLLFKTQLWVLQVALSDQSFWYFQDNPARVLFNYIINSEIYHNKILIEGFDNIIKSIDTSGEINSQFFISLINLLKDETNKNLTEQKAITIDKIKPLEKEEWFNFAYAKVAEQAMDITKNTQYQPIRDFAEKVWPYKFLQKLSKMTSLTIFDLPDFSKVLPANMKAMFNQHLIVFDALVTLANNKDGSKQQMEKMKKFISKANEGLATLAFDLDIDPRLTRALFSFVKFRLDIISQTTNPIAIEQSMQKIVPNELAFLKEVNIIIGESDLYTKTSEEIRELNYSLNDYFKLNHWYSFNEEFLKLIHVTKLKDYYLFIDIATNELRILNKPKIWSFVKNKTIDNFTEDSLQLNMLNFLVEYNTELANSNIEDKEDTNEIK